MSDEHLRQSHSERRHFKHHAFDHQRLFVKQAEAEINRQPDHRPQGYDFGRQFGNRTGAECMRRGNDITDDNQKETGNQIGKAGKGYHPHDLAAVKTPAGIQTVSDGAAGNDRMTGVVTDRKTDKAGKNPFPRCQFALDVTQCQIIIG